MASPSNVAQGYCVVQQPGTLDFQARQLFGNVRNEIWCTHSGDRNTRLWFSGWCSRGCGWNTNRWICRRTAQ